MRWLIKSALFFVLFLRDLSVVLWICEDRNSMSSKRTRFGVMRFKRYRDGEPFVVWDLSGIESSESRGVRRLFELKMKGEKEKAKRPSNA